MLKKLVLIFLVFIVLTSGFIYFYNTTKVNNSPAPEQASEQIPEQSPEQSPEHPQKPDNYKVYTDESSQYSISYPERWTISKKHYGDSTTTIKIDNTIGGEVLIYCVEPGVALGTGIAGIPDQSISDYITNSGKKGIRYDFLFNGKKEVHIFFDNAFVLKFFGDPEEYEKNKESIEKVYKSFDYKLQARTREKVDEKKSDTKTIEENNLREVNVDNELRKKLNIFFSNFSEAALPEFKKDELSNSNMVQFGIRHNLINNYNYVEKFDGYNGANGRISAKYVEDAVKKYLGKNISNHETVKAYGENSDGTNSDIGYFVFKDGFYLIPTNRKYQIDPARFPNGETAKFSQISKLYDSGNDLYIAHVDIYSVYPDNFQGDFYGGTPEDWKKQNQPGFVPSVVLKMIATIKRQPDGRYILIDYIENKK